MSTLNRREFIRHMAMNAAIVAAGTAFPGLVFPAQQVSNISGVEWNKAPCRFCGTGCHVQVGVENGKVVAVAGDKDAEVNKGLLCVKGYHVGSALYGKDRLTQPLPGASHGSSGKGSSTVETGVGRPFRSTNSSLKNA